MYDVYVLVHIQTVVVVVHTMTYEKVARAQQRGMQKERDTEKELLTVRAILTFN